LLNSIASCFQDIAGRVRSSVTWPFDFL